MKKIFIFAGIIILILGILLGKNIFSGKAVVGEQGDNIITLKVTIPCSGHAYLIEGALKKISGIANVKFRAPNYFDVEYDSTKISSQEILALEVFRQYKAVEVKR